VAARGEIRKGAGWVRAQATQRPQNNPRRAFVVRPETDSGRAGPHQEDGARGSIRSDDCLRPGTLNGGYACVLVNLCAVTHTPSTAGEGPERCGAARGREAKIQTPVAGLERPPGARTPETVVVSIATVYCPSRRHDMRCAANG
jgi:hypothetical protein